MKKRKFDLIEATMRHKNIIIIISVLLMAMGVVALMKMPRNEFPEFTIRQGVIVGVFPGATSADVEQQLTKQVENYIFSYKEVKKAKTYSQSKEGIMYIFVELNDEVTNADQFWSKMKLGLSELKGTLPTGVVALMALSDFGDTAALLITLSSDTKSYKEIEQELIKLEGECRKIPSASKIKHYGLQKEKIFVRVKPEKLNEYNIKSISLLASYQSDGMVNYAGALKDGQYNLAVHLPPNFQSEKDLADQIVYSDPAGNVVRLKDIATIERCYDAPDNYIKQNGMKTILLSLEMQPGNNIVEFGKEVEKVLTKFKQNCPSDIKVAKISELPKYVDDSVSNFMEEFLIAIIAVILVTMILLPFRVAMVAGITVPISVLITLCLLYFAGIELNTVSLAGLIIVLGMIVDNAIVVIDNHVEKLDHKYSVWHAAIKSVKELISPVIIATLAIFSAYFPLMIFLPGMSGEFVSSLPIVIGIALGVSILVAVFLVPFLNFVFIKKGLIRKKNKKSRKSFLDILQKLFDASLEKSFKYPKIVIISGIGIVVLSMLLFGQLDQRQFPEVERNQFAIEVYLPTGSSVQSTAKVVDSLEQIMLRDKRVTNVTSFIGTSSPRFHTVYAPQMPSPAYGQLLINTLSDKATREIVNEYSPKYSSNFANAHVVWKILAMQSFKAPIEIRISSDSINDIRAAEAMINEVLKKTDHIDWQRTDWNEKLQGISVNINRDKANRMGYSKAFVSTSLMVGLEGLPLTTIWEGDYPVDVKLKQENPDSVNIKTLEDQYIMSMSNFSAAPLRSFASFSPTWSEGTIVHRNGARTLTIMLDINSKIMSSAVFEKLRPQIDNLKLPDNVSIQYGGEFELQGEVMGPMSIALGVSIIVIFFILLFQFKKVKLSLLIMCTMLLALPGAVAGLIFMGYPFSLTCFIGITSLCGMVVRNGIILIGYARELQEKNKMSFRDAALAAGKRRMRPIFLTSAAASVGVIPMIISRSPLWGPLGTVICFGLLFSMVLTLYILPVLYSVAFKDKRKISSRISVPVNGLTVILICVFTAVAIPSKAQQITLDSCKSMALKNNFKIREATNEVSQSLQVKRNAMTNYFPKVSASVTALKFKKFLVEGSIPEMNLPVYDGNPASLAAPSLFTYFPGMDIEAIDYMNVANIMVAQPIFAGGRIFNGNKLAGMGYKINNLKLTMSKEEALVKTEEYYWTILSLNEKLKTVDSYIMLLDTLKRDVENAIHAGLIQRSDLLKIQLKQNELQVNRNKLTNGITLSKKALFQHIGLPYDSLVVLQNPLIVDEPKLVSSNPASAVNSRVEYKMLEDVVKVEKLQRRMSIGENLPQISVGVVGIYSDVMETTTKNAMIMGTVSIPISDWWGGSYKIKQNNLKIQIAEDRLKETSELLQLQISQTQNELNEQMFQIQMAQLSIEQAKENMKVTNDNYKAGVITVSELLEVQSLYQSALNTLSDVRYVYQIKKAKYNQAIGSYK